MTNLCRDIPRVRRHRAGHRFVQLFLYAPHDPDVPLLRDILPGRQPSPARRKDRLLYPPISSRQYLQRVLFGETLGISRRRCMACRRLP